MLETLVKGSYLMIPLLVCSWLTLAVVIDRALAFRAHRRIDNRSLRAHVLQRLDAGRVDEAGRLCADTPGPVSAVLLAGLQSYDKHRQRNKHPEAVTAAMDKAMDDCSLHAMSAVERRLNVLATIGNAAPLLGMTGTVTGMIRSFDALSKMGGLNAAAVAGGISEALITTATGLLIALAAVIPYNLFSAMADRIDLEIEESSSELLDFVTTRLETARPDAP